MLKCTLAISWAILLILSLTSASGATALDAKVYVGHKLGNTLNTQFDFSIRRYQRRMLESTLAISWAILLILNLTSASGAVAPDAKVYVGHKLGNTLNTQFDFSIRRYRARFCKIVCFPH